ncbi:carboxymuconolactone decarboxylase family protein [Planctomycetota bacterium]
MPMSPKEVLAQLESNVPKIVKALPDVAKPFFQGLLPNALKDGVLSKKQKELIALALAVQMNNEFCVCRHVKWCYEAGGTKEEMVEALGVAMLFGGGPSMSYASYAMQAMEELAE